MPLYPIAHFAVLKLGAVLVPTNPLYVERELEYQLTDSGAETVVVLDKLLGRLLSIRDRTPVKRIISAGIQEFLPPILRFLYGLKNRPSEPPPTAPGLYEYRDLMKRKVPSREAADVSPDDTAILLYTGGTTGLSKGAILTHRNLVCNVHQTKSWLSDLQLKQEIFLCALPFFHSYGMTTGLHLAVLCRCTMILLPRVELADVVKRIRKHRPTIFCGVPAMYNAINNYSGIKSSDLSSIRLCISGGAGLPADVQARFEEMSGGKLVEGYGLSEASPLVSVNPIFSNRKNGTIGVPVADTDARTVDSETGNVLPAGEVGELSVSGPQVMQGYWNKPEETANVLQDGWLKTGDMAMMDQDGYFTIVDRKKDLILSAGYEHLFPRSGGGPLPAPRRPGCCRGGGPQPGPGRSPQGLHRAQGMPRVDQTGRDSLLPREAGSIQAPQARGIPGRAPQERDRENTEASSKGLVFK